MTEDDVIEMQAMGALLTEVKLAKTNGLRITPENLILAAKLLKCSQTLVFLDDLGYLRIRTSRPPASSTTGP